jgi:hypothetical protein
MARSVAPRSYEPVEIAVAPHDSVDGYDISE